jgi:molecular chaperone GrpE
LNCKTMLPRASRAVVAALARRLPAVSSSAEPIAAVAVAASDGAPAAARALPMLLQARALSTSSTISSSGPWPITTSAAALAAAETAAGAATPSSSYSPLLLRARRRSAAAPLSSRRAFASDSKDDKDDAAKAASSSDSDGANDAAAAAEKDDAAADESDSPLARELDDARKKAAAMAEKLQYALAEAENVRQRARRELETKSQFAVADLAKQLLDVADNMWRAEEAVPKPVRAALFGAEGAADADLDAPKAKALLKALLEGLRATDRGLHEVLKKQGIERYDALGDKFDPNLHAAMFEVPDEKAEPGTVAAVHRRGYTIKGRVLRAAEVGVAKAP